MLRVLSDDDVGALLDLGELLPVLESAFLMQGRGAVERPDRPHFPVGTGLEDAEPKLPTGTALTMSAYIHGADHYATKIAGIHEGNEARDHDTVNALVVLTDAATGLPAAVMAGNRITNARTGAIGGLAAKGLASPPVTVGILGAGTQARWQTRAIAAATVIDEVRVYSPSDSRQDCAADLHAELDTDVRAVASPKAAVDGASVVVSATTAESPVFPGEALDPGALVVAVGAFAPETREVDTVTFERAARVFADVPDEVAAIGDIEPTSLSGADLVPFSAVFEGEAGRRNDDEIIVVESVGTAVLDAATGEYVLEAADAAGIGRELRLE
jgi:alanine dehydrogenase